MSKNDITFTLKVVNDAKAGLASLGIDLQKLVDKTNSVGDKGGQAAKRAADGAKSHNAAVRELVSTVTKAEAALNRTAQAQARLNQAQAAARAQARIVTARARTAENTSTVQAEREALRLTQERALAEQRLQREIARTRALAVASAQAAATRQSRDAISLTRARIPVDRDSQLAAGRVARDQASVQIAQSNAITTARMNELRIQREQVSLDRLRNRLAEERLRTAALEAATKGRDLQAARRLATETERLNAAQLNRQRQQVLLQNAQARHTSRYGAGGAPAGLFARAAHAVMGPPGGGGPNVWPGLVGNAGAASMALGRLGAAARGLGFMYVTSEIISAADAMRTLYARVGLVTDGVLQQGMAFRELTKVAQSTRAGLSEVVNVYYGLTRSNNTLGMSQREMIAITKGISQSIAVSGVNAQAASFGLMQLAQAFSSGQLRGDELNSVLEQLPALAQAIAKNVKLATGEIGLPGPGALKTIAEQGKLSVKQVVDAIKISLPELEKQFSKLPVTVGQGLEVMKNGFMVFIATVDKATGATNGLGRLLTQLGTYLSSDDFAKFAGDLGNSLASIASMIGTVIAPALRYLKDNIGAVTQEVTALTVAFIALRAVAKGAAVWSALVTLFGRLSFVFRSAALATTTLSAAQVALAGTSKALSLSFAGLAANPYVLALMAIAAAVGYVATKMYMAKKANEDFAVSLEGLREQREQLKSLTPEQIPNLDPNVVQSNLTNATQIKATLSEQLLPKEEEYEEAVAKLRKIRERIAELRKDAAGSTTGYSANRANDLERTAVAWERNIGRMRAELRLLKRDMVTSMESIQGWGAIASGALDRLPDKIAKTNLSAEDFNKLAGYVDAASPAVKQARDLADFNQKAINASLSDRRQLVEGLVPRTDVPAGFLPNAPLPEKQANEAYERLIGLARANLTDSPLAQSLRSINEEIRILTEENLAGGPLPVERKLMEIRKAIAAQQGKTVSANAPGIVAAAERARPSVERSQYLQEQRALKAAAKEKLDLAREDFHWIELRGAELIRERNISEAIRKLRADNAAITEADALRMREQILPDMQEAADAAILSLQKRKLVGELNDAGRAAEFLQAQLAQNPRTLAAGEPVLKLQQALADVAEVPLDTVLRNWNALLKEMGATAEEVDATLTNAAKSKVYLDMRVSIDEATLALQDQYATRLLVGEAAEREVMVQREVNRLVATGIELSRARREVELAMYNGGFDEALLAAKRARENPIQGPLEGMQKGYAEFLNEAADLTAQFADVTKSALEGVGQAFADLVVYGKANFKQFAAGVLRDVASMIVRFLVLRAVMAAVGYFSGTNVPVSSAASSSGGMQPIPNTFTPIASAKGNVIEQGKVSRQYSTKDVIQRVRLVPFALGGVFDAGQQVQKYAAGGVVKRPTVFPMANGGTGLMGEAGPEAILPLRRLSNGKLGVEATNGQSVNNNVFSPTIQISVDGSQSGKPEQNADLANRIGDQVGKMIDAKMVEFAQKQSRPGGLFASR